MHAYSPLLCSIRGDTRSMQLVLLLDIVLQKRRERESEVESEWVNVSQRLEGGIYSIFPTITSISLHDFVRSVTVLSFPFPSIHIIHKRR